MCGQYDDLVKDFPKPSYYIGAGPPVDYKHDATMFAPHMDYRGVVQRYVPYKDKRQVDPIVHEWTVRCGLPFRETFQMCCPNRAAMTASIAKYNRPQPKVDVADWHEAGEWTKRHFEPYMGDSKILPLDQCVTEADRTTSAGYPWSLWFKTKGMFLDSDLCQKVMSRYWEGLKTREPLVSLWTASLKRELRAVDKIAENKIRTFTASAVEHSIALNRMCLDANGKFYASNNRTWSFVGCSKFNRGFDRLYHRLNKHPNAFELDESSFDASLFRQAMEGQRDIRWELLHPFHKTEENRNILWNLYDQIVHSVIVLDNGEVVQKHTGNPSGSANTIVDNTMILFRLFAYAWLVKTRPSKFSKYRSYGQFMSQVEAALNGDDNTYTVSNEALEFFNAKCVAEVWSGIGVTTKSPCWGERKLEEVSFLSQDFVNVRGVWLPKPERDKIICSLLWGSEFHDARWTLLRAYALRLESWADETTRNDVMSLIKFIRKEYGHLLHGVVQLNPSKDGTDKPDVNIAMGTIETVYKTDDEIWRLYTMPTVRAGRGSDQNFEKLLEQIRTLE